ncbi:hypothetical protein DITRI_Ditri04bG0118200 [Diplodiscus trichospermus]
MYGLLENDPRYCGSNPNNVSNPAQYSQVLTELLNNMSSQAATEGPLRKYAAGGAMTADLTTVSALVQCTLDMDQKNCTECLTFAMRELANCCYGRLGCRVLRPTCILRFESNSQFFTQIAVPLPPPPPSPTTSSSPTSKGENGNNTTRTVIIVVASVVGSLILIIFSIFTFKKRRATDRSTEVEIIGVESLQFASDSVRVAPDNFSDANKLGQGGFGAVYKGMLPCDKEIAVRRPSRQSAQGNLEFKNEILDWQGCLNKMKRNAILEELRESSKHGEILAWRNWREGTTLNVIDPTLSDDSRNDILRCTHIAPLCVQQNIAARPTMASINFMLNSFSTIFPVPSQLAFLMQRNSESDSLPSLATNSLATESNNEVSITEPSPR